ncbi:MAG: ATP-binding cassette domain-containing protein, partial [Clostridia bacterium]|nr:ATP-binding cassette domain-containing protein [Clostridia bacterium]
MSMIKVENLTFSYPSSYDNIFENVSFNIDTNWKLGFVGRNGRGKTTFLNLLLGKYEYKGSITANVQFDYFPYYVSDERKLTLDIMKEICPLAEEWELMREISYMDTDTDVLLRPFNRLSKGEQTKVLLGALFLNEGHFLLIDEPTNHLDTKTREIVSEYLKKKKGFILVSHDRCFLDSCVDHILSINRTNTEVQKGNFSSWLMNFERRQRFEEAQNQRLEKDIGRLKRAARRAAHWSEKIENSKYGNGPVDRGYVGHKAAKMMKRSKSIEKNQVREIEQKSELLKNNENVECLKIFPLEYYRDVMVKFLNVSVCYEGKEIFAPISFEISKGERVAIEGRNGSGKSSLLKLLIDGQAEYKGSFNTGSGIIISYVPQDTSHLKGKLSDFAYENKI